MHLKTLFLIISALSLMACSSTRTSTIQAENINVGDESQKGFSLSFPEESEWDVVQDETFLKTMTKEGLLEDERYTIQVLMVNLPKFKNRKEFRNFIVKRMKNSQRKSGSKVVEQHTQWAKGENNECIQHSSKEKYPNRSSASMLDVVSFICQHSNKEKAGVYLAYSKRYDQKNSNEKIIAKAEELFEHLEINAF